MIRRTSIALAACAVLALAATGLAETEYEPNGPKKIETHGEAASDPHAGHNHAPGAHGLPAVASVDEPMVDRSSKYDLEAMRALTVQHAGRRKPFDTFCRQEVKLILGRHQKEDPVYTLLSMMFERERFANQPIVKVANLQLRAVLGLKESEGYTSFANIASSQAFAEKIDELRAMPMGTTFGPNQNAVLELRHRFLYFQALPSKINLLPVPGKTITDGWAPLSNPENRSAETRRKLKDLLQKTDAAWKSGNVTETNAALNQLGTYLGELQKVGAVTPWRGKLEIALNQLQPFRYAWILLLGACTLLGAAVLSPKKSIYIGGVSLLLLGFGAATFGLAARTLIVMRAPVSNLYEATIFATFAAVTVGTIFELTYRKRYFGLAAAIFGTLAFMLADLSPTMDRAISPLVPVLRSYWLNIHVTCMLLSYGTFAVAFVLGIFYFAKWFPAKGYPVWAIGVPIAICVSAVLALFIPMQQGMRPELWHYVGAMLVAPAVAVAVSYAWVTFTGGGDAISADDRKELVNLERYMYRAIQVGFLIITTGVILGAVWANESWGRYWGWDPKETWAFITLLVYGVFIHGRLSGWFRGPRAAIWSVIGFYSVLFTFYGVSFVLPGLHSYLSD